MLRVRTEVSGKAQQLTRDTRLSRASSLWPQPLLSLLVPSSPPRAALAHIPGEQSLETLSPLCWAGLQQDRTEHFSSSRAGAEAVLQAALSLLGARGVPLSLPLLSSLLAQSRELFLSGWLLWAALGPQPGPIL